MDIAPTYVEKLVDQLENDPRRACETLIVVLKGLKEARSVGCLRRMISALAQQPYLLELLEHCLFHHRRINVEKSPGSFNGATIDGATVEYIEKMLDFLTTWITTHREAMYELFSKKILGRSIVNLSWHGVVKSNRVVACHLAILLSLYLNDEDGDLDAWFEYDGGLAQMRQIGEGFAQTCFGSQQTFLLHLFLRTAEQSDFGENQPQMAGVFMYHMFGLEAAVKNRAEALEYNVHKKYFLKQLATARLYTLSMDYRNKSKVFKEIVSRLMQAEKLEQKEVPAIKSLFARVLLKMHEPRETLHDRYADEIVGLNRSLSPYEEEKGRKRQSFDPWSYMELPDSHVRAVHDYLATNEELSTPLGTASSRVMTASGRRDFVRTYLNNIRSGAVLGDDDMSIGSDSGSESGLPVPFARFYHRELEHMINGVLRLLRPDDIDFTQFLSSTDVSDSDEMSVANDSSTARVNVQSDSEPEDARISEDVPGMDRGGFLASQGSSARLSADVRDADGGGAPPESFAHPGSRGDSGTSTEPEMEGERVSQGVHHGTTDGGVLLASSACQRSLCESCTDADDSVTEGNGTNHGIAPPENIVVDLTYDSD